MIPHSDADRPPLGPSADVSVTDGPEAESTPGTTVEVWVRSLSDGVQPLLDGTLRRLREADGVEAIDVAVWGRSFDPTGPAAATDPGRALANRLEAFRRWAAENDASFDPFFRPRTVEGLAGEACTRVDLPTVALAEYRDGDLAFVSPCRLGGRYRPVLERAERAERAERLAADDPRTATAVQVAEGVESAGGNRSVRT